MRIELEVPDEVAKDLSGEEAAREYMRARASTGEFVKNYIGLAKRTESLDPDASVRVLRCMRLLHGGIGMATEAGELLDNLKKHIYYGKPLDEVNLMEEIGDSFWYCAIILDVLGYEWEDVMRRNIDKLRARFPNKFEHHQALNRDLDKERQTLESENVGS